MEWTSKVKASLEIKVIKWMDLEGNLRAQALESECLNLNSLLYHLLAIY